MAYTYEQLKAKGYSEYKIQSMLASQPKTALPTVQKPPVSAVSQIQKATQATPVPTKTTTGASQWQDKPTAGKPSDMSDREWQIYNDRLNKVGTSATQNKIIDAQSQQQTAMQAAGSQAERDALYETGLQDRKTQMLERFKLNPNMSQEYVSVFEQYWNPKTGMLEGISPEEMQRVKEAEWATLPEDKRRNYEAEQAALQEMGAPGQGEEGEYYKSIYNSDQLSTLIETGQIDAGIFDPAYLSEIGLTADRLEHLVASGYLRPEFLEQMKQMQAQGINATGQMAATPAPTNEMMDILSESLNAKNNFKNQELGTSDLFGMAGLSGYAVLAQSLGQRASEMEQKSKSAANVISATGGAMADVYKEIASNYDKIRDDYTKHMDRLIKIDEQAQEHEFLFAKMEQQHQLDLEMESFKAGLKERERAAERSFYRDLFGDVPNIGGVDIKDEKTKGILGKIFGIGDIGDWCGVFASKISDAGSVGNSWAEKRQRITHQDNPTLGDKLLIPILVKTDKGNAAGEYGHVAVVIGYDKASNTITVVESNRDGRQNKNPNNKGVVTIGTYNLDALASTYGDDWGFMKGNLRKQYYEPLLESLPPQLKGAVQLGSGDAANGIVNMAKGFTAGFVDAIAGGGAKGNETKAGTPLERYESATGKKIDKTAMDKMAKENKNGTLENYLTNLESDAKAKADKEAKKNMSKEDKKKQEIIESAKEALTDGKKPDEIFKTIKGSYDKETAEKIMAELGYKWKDGVWIGARAVFTPGGWIN